MVINLDKQHFPAGALLVVLDIWVLYGGIWGHYASMAVNSTIQFYEMLREKWLNLRSTIWKNVSFPAGALLAEFGGMQHPPQEKKA